MKPVHIEHCTGLDRLATWSEVRCARLVSSKGILRAAACDDFVDETTVGLCGFGCKLPEDIAWLDIVREMPNLLSN
jgi:hypothetical protein